MEWAGIIFLIIVAAIAISLASKKGKVVNAQQENAKKSEAFEAEVLSSGFCIEKRIEHPETSTLFFVDGAAKKWAVKTYQNNYGIFSFDELVDFELVENNESVATATLNAIVAGGIYQGDKNITGVCGMMQIHVTVDNLQSPHLVIPLVVAPVDKHTDFYTKALGDAHEIISTLTYILNHKGP